MNNLGKGDITIVFSNNLKRIRKLKGYSQEGLSEILEMDPSQYGKIERGQLNVTLETIEKLCIALRIQPIDLFR